MSVLYVIGLAGKAATGKTSTSDLLVPNHSPRQISPAEGVHVHLDQLKLAAPIYEIVDTLNISGQSRKERVEYIIFDVLRKLFGNNPLFGCPNLDELVALTKEVADESYSYLGRESKPRAFMQWVGDIGRYIKPDCYVDLLIQKARSIAAEHENEINSYADEDFYHEGYTVIIIDDIRFDNEAQRLKDVFDSHFTLVKLECDDSERLERMIDRGDQVSMNDLNHPSESMNIPEELFDLKIDTTNNDVMETLAQIIKFVNDKFKHSVGSNLIPEMQPTQPYVQEDVI